MLGKTKTARKARTALVNRCSKTVGRASTALLVSCFFHVFNNTTGKSILDKPKPTRKARTALVNQCSQFPKMRVTFIIVLLFPCVCNKKMRVTLLFCMLFGPHSKNARNLLHLAAFSTFRRPMVTKNDFWYLLCHSGLVLIGYCLA